jgi:SAM-dependent methyltransferase
MDRDRLLRLRKHFYHPICKIKDNVHKPNNGGILDYRFEDFPQTGAKGLDLGSGLGYLLARIKLTGNEGYGVEINPFVARISRNKLGQMFGNSSPQVLTADYFDPNFPELEFKDGTKVLDIKTFFCYSYNGGHAFDILFNVMARNEFSIGSSIYFEEGPSAGSFHEEFGKVAFKLIDKTGYCFIKDSCGGILVKNKETTLKQEELKLFNQQLFNTEYKRINPFMPSDYKIKVERPKIPQERELSLRERLELSRCPF